MFDIGFQEMLVIGVLALLVFGPGKLPELGRMIGRALREFRRASDEFRSTVETNLHINDPDPIIAPSPIIEPAPVAALPSDTASVSTTVESVPAVAGGPGGAVLRSAVLATVPQERLRLGLANSRGRARLLQARGRGARAGLHDVSRVRALGAGVDLAP